MAHAFHEIAFTAPVKRRQAEAGSRAAYARFEDPDAPGQSTLGEDEAAFIAERDSFYLASVSETGWPYIQHRGGPKGFVQVLDASTLAFADFRGNRQYITLGNLDGNTKVNMFLMDYRNRTRLKLFGHAEAMDLSVNSNLAQRLALPGYPGRPERAIIIKVAGVDWNCPQHITPRFTEAEVRTAVKPLLDRIAELEAKLAKASD